MRPIIDISQVANNQAFISLDHAFGLAGRVNLYNNATNDADALRYIDAMLNVLDRDDYARDLIRQRGLTQAAAPPSPRWSTPAAPFKAIPCHRIQQSVHCQPAGSDALMTSAFHTVIETPATTRAFLYWQMRITRAAS